MASLEWQESFGALLVKAADAFSSGCVSWGAGRRQLCPWGILLPALAIELRPRYPRVRRGLGRG